MWKTFLDSLAWVYLGSVAVALVYTLVDGVWHSPVVRLATAFVAFVLTSAWAVNRVLPKDC